MPNLNRLLIASALASTLLLGGGCHDAPRPPRQEPSDPFASDENLTVLAADISWYDATPGAQTVARLDGDATAALSRLKAQPLLRGRVIFAGARTQLIVGESSLTLDEGLEGTLQSAAISGRLPPRRMVELLEGGAGVRRGGYTVEASPSEPVEDGQTIRRQHVTLRFRQRSQGAETSVTARLTIWFSPLPPERAALTKLAIDWVGLPFLDTQGRMALHRLEAATGLPLRWRLEMQSDPGSNTNAPPILQGHLGPLVATQQPRRSFALQPTRLNHVPTVATLVAPHDLAAIRHGRMPLVNPARFKPEALARRAIAEMHALTPGVLAVDNQTPWQLYVLADGVAVACVPPKSHTPVGSLTPGYYRIHARSLFGTYYEGPRDLYVPGEISFGTD